MKRSPLRDPAEASGFHWVSSEWWHSSTAIWTVCHFRRSDEVHKKRRLPRLCPSPTLVHLESDEEEGEGRQHSEMDYMGNLDSHELSNIRTGPLASLWSSKVLHCTLLWTNNVQYTFYIACCSCSWMDVKTQHKLSCIVLTNGGNSPSKFQLPSSLCLGLEALLWLEEECHWQFWRLSSLLYVILSIVWEKTPWYALLNQ